MIQTDAQRKSTAKYLLFYSQIVSSSITDVTVIYRVILSATCQSVL